DPQIKPRRAGIAVYGKNGPGSDETAHHDLRIAVTIVQVIRIFDENNRSRIAENISALAGPGGQRHLFSRRTISGTVGDGLRFARGAVRVSAAVSLVKIAHAGIFGQFPVSVEVDGGRLHQLGGMAPVIVSAVPRLGAVAVRAGSAGGSAFIDGAL